MDAKTLDALKRSIAKWDKNSRIRNTDNAVTSADECPLCLIFHEDFNPDAKDCSGCPVKGASGEPFCWKTPYGMASRAASRGRPAEFRAAAKEESAFLRSLLPDGESA